MCALLSVCRADFIEPYIAFLHTGCSKTNTAMSKIQLYVTSVSSSNEIKRNQQHIKSVLDSKKYEYEEIDIASNSEFKDKMREIVGNPTALPPQLCRGAKHLGDHTAFSLAIEEETLDKFLQVTN